METIVIIVHLLIALAIIGLILMQQGKGAEAGASFGGGASQTVFGSQGGSNFFAKATAVLAFVFFATSFSLAIIAKNNTEIGVDLNIPTIVQQPAIESEIPVINEAPSVDAPIVDTNRLESELPVPVQEIPETVTEPVK